MYTDILPAFDRMACLHRRKKTPFAERFKEYLVQPRTGRRFDEFYIDRSIDMDREASRRDGLIGLLAQIVRKLRQRLRNRVGRGVTR